MSVYVSHLVFEALGDTDDQVVDERSDSSEGSDIFARAVVQLDVDDVLLWVGEGNSDVAEILCELASWAFDGDLAGLDVDFDCKPWSLVFDIELLHDQGDNAAAKFSKVQDVGSTGRTALWNLQRLL